MIPEDKSLPPNNIDETSKPKKSTPPKDGRKPQEKVVQGKVIRKKRSNWSDFYSATSSVISTICSDVLIPALKDMVYDAITQGANRTIYGTTQRISAGRGPNTGNRGHISYNHYSSSRNRSNQYQRPSNKTRTRRSSYSVDDTIFETRDEAETVLDRLYDIVSQHEFATVADFYEMIGVKANYVDENWGWTDLHGSDVYRDRNGGFALSLPKPEVLD